MKFTDGYWLIKDNFEAKFATGFVRAEKNEKELSAIAAFKNIDCRSAMVDTGALQVQFTSPIENIIRVKITHFAGRRTKRPSFYVNSDEFVPCIKEDETFLYFTTGAITARINKTQSWQVEFVANDIVLTSSGYHAMGYFKDKETQRTYITENLMLDVGENVYGLGEHFGPYIKNGQSIDIWNEDGGTASEQGYKNIPFYMTNRGYGVFVEDTSDVRFEIASEKVERVQFSVEGESLTYDFIYGGTPKQVLSLYTKLTGRPALPPAWSFGLWLSTSFTTEYDEKTASSFIDGMAERGIPLSVFHFDCFWMKGMKWCDFEWDDDTFPDPVGMLKRYHEKGLKICCWINPYIAQASPLFKEGMDNHYFIETSDGDVWQTDRWQAGMSILDVTNPSACKWYTKYLRKLMDMGVDCFKTDFGERIPVTGVKYFDGSDPRYMHNYYSYLYNKTVFELIEEVKGKGEAIVFARSATAGGQQFPVHWGGDNSASYVSMAETLRAGLSMSHSGFGFWSHDISGFESTAPADVYKRWCQFGLLSSHSRLHGSSSYRVPWLFDEESSEVVAKFAKLKCRLMPYIYRKAIEAHENGIPVLRPMILEFPNDPACETLDRQYMLGDKLLVAPVFRKEGIVQYYIPDGEWYELLTGEKKTGGRWVTESYDFMSLPLLVRPGTVLPLGKIDTRPDYDYAYGIELHVYGLKENQTEVVEIPDINGNIDAKFVVSVKNGKVVVYTESKKEYKVIEN